jgi:TetR/AcrR family transcriptional repressor of nem operon
MGDLNEQFREKINKAFARMKEKVLIFLEGAQNNGEIAPDPDMSFDETADFILNSWEGALLRLKEAKSKKQMHLFYHIVFDRLLCKNKQSKEK